MVREAPQPLPEGIPHYYGDVVRQLFIVAAGLMLIAAPFYTDSLRIQLPFIVVGAIVLVAIAALVNPHKQGPFMAGAIASGAGLALFEMWALYWYEDSNILQFLLRQAIAVVFLVAFYFCMKTVRAFILHSIGKHDEPGEFDDKYAPERPSKPRKATSLRDEFLPWFAQRGGRSEERGAAEADTPVRQTPGRSKKELYPTETPYEEVL